MHGELLETVALPPHHLSHDADNQRRRCRHQRRVRGEVGRDLHSIAAWAHTDASRPPVGSKQRHRRGEHVREQIRELLHSASGAAIMPSDIERHVVVRTESHEPNVATGSRLPSVELVAQKRETFPERACASRATAARDLDHRRRDLHHARVEIQRDAGRQVIRPTSAMHQRATHHVPWRAEHVFRPLGHAIDDRRELCFEPNCRKRSARGHPSTTRAALRSAIGLSLLAHRISPSTASVERREFESRVLTTGRPPT